MNPTDTSPEVVTERVRTHEFSMTIDGRGASGADRFDVTNPATGQTLNTAPRASETDVDAAAQAAHRAFPGWAADPEARRAALRTIADVLETNAEFIGAVVTLEQGKPYLEGIGDVQRSAAWFRYYAELDLGNRVIQDDENGFVEVLQRPLGVVVGIIPWNQPILMGAWKAAPALLAGCTMILKPSPSTPLTALALGEVLREVLPPGVLSVLSGPEPLGSALINHPLVRKISFTGSTEVGKEIARTTASDLKRLTLELGGNDAAIVLDDADPAAVAEDLFWASFKNNGQMCALIKRLYVPEARRGEYTDALADIARSVRLGDGMVPDIQLGPLANAPQHRRVVGLAEATAAGGATVAAGGTVPDGEGFFFSPMVVTDVADGSPIVAEEQFGPILPVIGYDDIDQAVRRANDSPYGLGGSVWGTDTDRARQVAARLDSGGASVNHHTRGIGPHLPFGGAKWSGVGVENGPWGLEAYTQLQTLAGPARKR